MPPGRVWNAEADAKLFCGVLAQLQDASLKLDYDALARYMGPGAVRGRMQRLRATARAEGRSTPSAGQASSPVSAPDSASPSVKRKRATGPRTPRTPHTKKPKNGQGVENPPEVEINPLVAKEEGEEALVVKTEGAEEAKTAIKTDPEETEDDPSMDV
ncbi:unnamed protein product [Penicillium manginii]